MSTLWRGAVGSKENLRGVLAAATCLVLLLQFAQPDLANPPVTAEFEAPVDVKRILRQSCYNCHSNETRLAWFDRMVPASWLVARDVRRARAHLNFSQLGAEPKARQKAVLFEAVNQIQMGAMPLGTYARIHPQAAIRPEELAVLRTYLLPVLAVKAFTPPDAKKADDQYRNWIAEGGRPKRVKDAPNGISFPSDYRNWAVISSTERNDTNTLKVILGNDIAVSAIKRKTINPWPDGTVFAKVSWRQLSRENGETETGEFLQVAFMIKNAAKYSSTAGWGWAEWLGSELRPFGTDANFATECVSCHLPLRENDYVYTFPIALRSHSE